MISDLIAKINELSQGNQMLAAGIGVYSAGALTFLLRNVPAKIFNFLKKNLTTTMIVTTANPLYFNILKWINDNNKLNLRIIKYTANIDEFDNETSSKEKINFKSIGYGTHLLFINKKLIYASLTKEKQTFRSKEDKEILTISKLGRSHAFFDKLIELSKHSELNNNEIKLLEYKYENIHQSGVIKKRKLETIFINKDKISYIVERIKTFINSEQWYIDNGIPYQLGIILYGPPGTGKTTLIKYLATFFERNLLVIKDDESLARLSKLSYLINNKKYFTIYEDIDSIQVLNKTNKATIDIVNDISDKRYTLSDLLNSIDGLETCHGRIFICSTNNIDNLIEPFLRPGRIDVKLEIGYVSIRTLNSFTEKYFNKSIPNDFKLKYKITQASLQEFILTNKSFDDVINYCKDDI